MTVNIEPPAFVKLSKSDQQVRSDLSSRRLILHVAYFICWSSVLLFLQKLYQDPFFLPKGSISACIIKNSTLDFVGFPMTCLVHQAGMASTSQNCHLQVGINKKQRLYILMQKEW